MSNFVPFEGKIVIEPIHDEGILLNDSKKYEEMGRVVIGNVFIKPGDVVFFLAYGVEQTPEYEGETYYVIPWSHKFIIGYIPCTTNEANVKMGTSMISELQGSSQMGLSNAALDATLSSSSTSESPTEPTSPTI